jgi:hypothetical protein
MTRQIHSLTINSTFNEPYEVARRFATLDHLGLAPLGRPGKAGQCAAARAAS